MIAVVTGELSAAFGRNQKELNRREQREQRFSCSVSSVSSCSKNLPQKQAFTMLSCRANGVEFHCQAPFVDRFQQAWAFIPMHFDRGADHVVRYSRGLGEKRMHGRFLVNREDRGNRERSLLCCLGGLLFHQSLASSQPVHRMAVFVPD